MARLTDPWAFINDIDTMLDELAPTAATVTNELTRIREKMSELDRQRSLLHSALIRIDEAWSGSNLGYHAYLYFGDFVRPPLAKRFDPEWGGYNGLPDGWSDRDLAEVRAAVEQVAGTRLDDYTSAATQLVEKARETLTEVAIVAAPIRQIDGLDSEVELLNALEGFDLEPKLSTSVPGGMTRDSRAIAEGMHLAPHQHVRYAVGRAAKAIDACEKAMTLADRLCRQIAGGLRHRADPGSVTDAALETAVRIVGLLRRFDASVRVLQGRGRSRSDYNVEDEYDVQDFLHAILRLHFEDVRPEEVTPSYAGSSSRMDFLLKRERVVVEAKMTRPNLRDREIGKELAEDIVRYGAHPDTRVLICFVYDPQRHVQNPRGIEDDLAKASTQHLEVAVVIAQ